MAKRKRDDAGHKQEATRKALKADVNENGNANSQKQDCASEQQIRTPNAVTIQIITGSYERILHGITATVFEPSTDDEPTQSVQFVDNFLFQAHASAIKCLALGPLPEQNHQQSDGLQKVMLASGGTDERVNLYTLSASSPPASDSTKFPTIPTLAGNKILENPKNRELGSLLHHSSAITALYFPSRSKLLSAAEDNTIAVTRTRDWLVVSTIKVPRPKVQGRPSGDTAPPGGAPAGVNDFAVHPSMKLMLTVGRGEKCMRLWNLVTGRKAGVLNFDRRILESVLEGKYSSGEGRRISWDSEGEEFAVAFERGAVVFGIDSVPTQVLLPSPRTKLHQLKYIDVDMVGGNKRGKDHGQSSRIKDFEVLPVKAQGWNNNKTFLIVTAGSDGAVKLWMLNEAEFPAAVGDRFPGNKKGRLDSKELKNGIPSASASTAVVQVGRLLGTYESSNRITCMKAFVMLAPPTGDLDDSDFSGSNEDEDSSGSDGED
ncbi:conserved hypothetical protein [Histoplasma capsulatum G186AR]|uniref:60S ribosome biogenesis protein Mak11 n=1 Tax=Ajellomyces capsulatus (strain G186AR / H82 / ATCC MYA-2454 / RMSCC 2432) TaxID=447093 RepID=C0NAD7_AJECG|nr:uncharacterized protein HCBG_00083 [Histoplasma capsulatum G186AR]EEH10628.1 conserved hypothetical protein [Histoplasma capsulatum G186AR]